MALSAGAVGCSGRTYLLGDGGAGGSGGTIGDAGAGATVGDAGDTGDTGTGGTTATGGHGGGARGGTGGTGTGGTGTVELSCGEPTTQQFDPATMPGYQEPADALAKAQQIVGQMSLDQRILQMEGSNDGHDKNWNDIERSVDVPLAGGQTIRGYQYRDGARGLDLAAPQVPDRVNDSNNFSTVFPAESARAASWDLTNEAAVGEAMGDEVMASKNDILLAPGVTIVRHPYWGRTQEAYGEDMYAIGRMASAFTAGLQRHVAGCATHFLANNIENGRSAQNAQMDEQTLREIYGRAFQMVVQDGGVACVMAAYNAVNGVKATQNRHLLTDILRDDFGFRGFVISDWWAMPGDQGPVDAQRAQENAIGAANAGLDVELPWWLNYGALPQVVSAGQVDEQVIGDAATRVLRQKFRFNNAYSTDPFGKGTTTSILSGGSIATNPTHIQLAEDTEVKSAVLLTNGASGTPVLPIKDGTVASIAVIGAKQEFQLQSTTYPKSCGSDKPSSCTFDFATDVALGDRGTSRVNADPAQSIGPLAGIEAVAAAHGVESVVSASDAAEAAAASADLNVVVVGYTPADEGEEYTIRSGGDRASLSLPTSPDQAQLVSDVLALGKPTVVIIESGSIVAMPWLSDDNDQQANIWAGYGGMHGGLALARLMFADGGANFSGKTTLAWALEQDLQPFRSSDRTTQMGYFFGYREFDRRAAAGDPVDLVFPFGHGLSYTTFSYDSMSSGCSDVGADAVIPVTAHVTNTGPVAGDEVVFAFVKGPTPVSTTLGEARPVKELKSFAKVHLQPGAGADVSLPIRVQDLKHWQGDASGQWVIDSGTYTVLVGPSGDDGDLTLSDSFTVHD